LKIVAFRPKGLRKVISGLMLDNLILNLNASFEALLKYEGFSELEAKIKAGRELPENPNKLIAKGVKTKIIIRKLASKYKLLSNLDKLIFNLKSVELKAPVPKPGKIIGVGLNYLDHIKEAGRKIPSEPIVFSKAPTSITGPYDPIILPRISNQVDYEAELAIVIGAKCKNIKSENEAEKYILGYMAANDVTARDIEFKEPIRFFSSKSLDTFCPIGPGITLAEDVNPNNLTIMSKLNGEVMQKSNTKNMVFNVRKLVYLLSQDMTLEPGDIILTGTPGGVGFARDPPIFLKPNDIIEVYVEKIGCIRNQVVKQ